MNGREDFLDLKYFYEGVGGNSKSVIAADNNIQDLFYAGKNNSHTWWE